MHKMIYLAFGENTSIIQVQSYSFGEYIFKHPIYQPLQGFRIVQKNKRHKKILKQTFVYQETGFVCIMFRNPYLLVCMD